MNILFIGTVKFGLGGVGSYIQSIISCKKRCFQAFAGVTSEEGTRDCKVVEYDFRYNVFSLIPKVIQLNKIINNNSIDLVHVHTQRGGLLLAILKVIINRNVKIIYTPHGFRHSQKRGVSKRIHFFLEKFILSQVNLMTAITNFEKNEISEYSYKIKKIKSVIELKDENKSADLYQDFSISKNKKVVVMVGSLDARKNPKLFIDVASSMKSDEVVFVWFGSGELLESMLTETRRRGVSERLKFVGHCNHENLYSYLRQADLMFMTSTSEGFPLSILEAFYCGLPVLSNDFLGVDEIINGENGVIFPYNDYQSAKNNIEEILTNDLRRERIIAQGRSFVQPYIDADRFRDEYYNVYLKVFNEG